LFLAEPADEQLQPLPRCHTSSLTASAISCRAQSHQAAGGSGKEFGPVPSAQGRRRSSTRFPRGSRSLTSRCARMRVPPW
jgi:hypothetical protein